MSNTVDSPGGHLEIVPDTSPSKSLLLWRSLGLGGLRRRTHAARRRLGRARRAKDRLWARREAGDVVTAATHGADMSVGSFRDLVPEESV